MRYRTLLKALATVALLGSGCAGAYTLPVAEYRSSTLLPTTQSPVGSTSWLASAAAAVDDGAAALPSHHRADESQLGANLALELSGSAQLTLWTFIENINAQQNDDDFSQTRTSARAIEQTLNSPVSAVPLPASTWLFVMGLLGFVGSRLQGKRKQASRTSTSAPQPA